MIKTLDDYEFRGKTVILRCDLNSPYDSENKRINDFLRIKESAKTVRELSNKGAKVVVLAHQGRKGGEGFTHLNRHAYFLERHAGVKVKFIDDVAGKVAKDNVKKLKDGEVIMLDNVRLLDDENEPLNQKNSMIVQALEPLADVFVNDAFSVSHRAHASVTGWSLPTYAGRLMQNELRCLDNATKNVERPLTLMLGGAKPDDCFNVLKAMIDDIDTALVCGILGTTMLHARGYKLGKEVEFLTAKGFTKMTPELKEFYEKHKDKIINPVDMAYDDNGRKEVALEELPIDFNLMDIGSKTMEKYSDVIKNTKAIIVKGTAGIYEKKGFALGTKAVMEAIADSNCFSLMGGGDTSTSIDMLKIPVKKFSHISLAGGAFIEYLSGKKLPGLKKLGWYDN